MSLITKRVREQVRTRLSDLTTGFNATYAALAGNSDYPDIKPVAIDFNGGLNNFFMAQVDPSMLIETTNIRFPVMCMYGTNIVDDNRQKFQMFSGDVNVFIDYHISFKASRVQFDFESELDCVEDTMIQIMNRPTNQNWDLNTVYNGGISVTRYPLRIAAENWRQSMRFGLRFEVDET